MIKKTFLKSSLSTVLLAILLVATLCLLPMTTRVVNAAISGHADNCEVAMNAYITSNTPSNYQKIDGVKTKKYSGSQEKWQLIRTKTTTEQTFNLAQELIAASNLVKGSSFTLSASNSSGTSTMRGGYFNVDAGVGAESPLGFVEGQLSLDYEREKVNTTTLEQARSVSFTVPNVQTIGTWALQQVITKHDYKIMRFRLTPYYATRNVYDKKGKVTGTERYLDHYEWTHYASLTYSTNNSEYFRIQKIA